MAQNRQTKLELTWVGKYDDREALEPRILVEDAEYSYSVGVKGDSVSGHGMTGCVKDGNELGSAMTGCGDNMLIHGDNLLALKALEQEYVGKVKCIYIDPPYNTGHAFEHYDDGLEHSIWLGLMRERLELLHKLLANDGSIWISIDDDEQAYLKVLMDEVFGRRNFVNNVIWQKIHSIKNDAKYLSDNHDFVLVYAKNKEILQLNMLSRTQEMDSRYKNIDNDIRGPWQSGDLVANEERINGYYDVLSPMTGKSFNVPKGKHWVYSEENMKKMIEENRIWFGKDGNAFPRKKRFLSEVKQGRKGDTVWLSCEVGHNQEAKKEVKQFNSESVFDTPKPERLIERVLTLATNEGDLVLDSFLGSGTTAAVAHKMGRKWIGVELGEHAKTHCYPRMKMVCDGEDQGGISKAQGWKGGGGFKFYTLAPSLLNEDKFGNMVINKEYNATMLAAAMAKHEGFVYEPTADVFWKQGKSSENDYIYTTTQFVTVELLDAIAQVMKEGESLLVCSTSFQKECRRAFTNIKVKKIPQMLLGRCAFGVDESKYRLNIVDMPQMDDDDYDEEEDF